MENQDCKCSECGAVVTVEYERPYQEYAGAAVQGGYEWYECSCGHYSTKTALWGYNIRENKRGW
jgi:hypothetical protein